MPTLQVLATMRAIHKSLSSCMSQFFAFLGLLCLGNTSTAFLPTSFGWRQGQNRCSVLQLHANDNHDAVSRPRICVLGGGFGGVNTALTLSNLPWPSDQKPIITLVDRKERFVFLPLLYELCVDAASLEEVAPTFRSLLEGTEVDFVQKEVTGVDVTQNVVHTTTVPETAKMESGTIPYDALVVATGAQLNLDAIPGAKVFALPFHTVEQCYELRRQLNVLDSLSSSTDRKIEVVIIGGGYSGVELALNTLERLGGTDKCKVILLHRGSQVLQYATDYNRKTGQDRLEMAGVNVMTDTNVQEVLPASAKWEEDVDMENGQNCLVKVVNKNGEESAIYADLLLWTAGATSLNDNQGVLNSILPRDQNGRIVTGKLLRAKGLHNVFALGDCSRAKKVPFAATAQVAMQQAPVVAWNVFATLRNRTEPKSAVDKEIKLLPFNYIDLGEMITLGNDDATISSLGGLVELSGPGASVLRRLIYAVRMPTAQQAVTAALESTERRLLKSKTGKRGGKPIKWK